MSKGSRPRPFSVTQKEFGERIEGIFGKKSPKEQYSPPPLPADFYKNENKNDTKS
jgi:hypothetical protein